MNEFVDLIIFDHYSGGHHAEYINHLHNALINKPNFKVKIVVGNDFTKYAKFLKWKKCDNITFEYISFQCTNFWDYSYVLKSFYINLKIRKVLRRYSCKHIFFIALMPQMPFISFGLPKGTSYSGIIYMIYRNKINSLFSTLINKVKYFLLANDKQATHVYLLNDKDSAVYFNSVYHTDKFSYLVDPYKQLCYTIERKYMRARLNIDAHKLVLFHFGGLTRRKGNLEILKAFSLLDIRQRDKYCLIFAGRIIDDIQKEFYEYVNHLSLSMSICVYDRFCEYSFLADLCNASDYVLIPYLETAQSSGVISYAVQCKRPVIGPKEGLLGKIIKKYNLGICVDSNFQSLADLFASTKINGDFTNMNIEKYLQENTVERFTTKIVNNL